jgi:hypothetical protein
MKDREIFFSAKRTHLDVGRHALELDELRTGSDQKIAKLQGDLADARAALSADKENLQDEIFELKDQIRDEASRLSEALKLNEEMSLQMQTTQVWPALPDRLLVYTELLGQFGSSARCLGAPNRMDWTRPNSCIRCIHRTSWADRLIGWFEIVN